MNQARRQTQSSTDGQIFPDHELRQLVLTAAARNPGLIKDRNTENFLISQKDSPEYWRLSTKQRAWIIKIAIDQLGIRIPEHLL